METARSACPPFASLSPRDYLDCAVTSFGEFGAVDGEVYYYATYCLIPRSATEKAKCGDGSATARIFRERAMAVFTRGVTDSNVRILFDRAARGFEGRVYDERPAIVQTSAGPALQLSAASDGTGHSNQSEYFLRKDGQWAKIESRDWLVDLQRRVPGGLRVFEGLWPDLTTMEAKAGLYRPADSQCCPSGGTANVKLKLVGRRLAVESVTLEPAAR